VQNLVSHDIFPNKLFQDKPMNERSLALANGPLCPRTPHDLAEIALPPDDMDT
jgi:hypothetical protein